VRQVQVVVI
jgi:hypothetical protein